LYTTGTPSEASKTQGAGIPADDAPNCDLTLERKGVRAASARGQPQIARIDITEVWCVAVAFAMLLPICCQIP
jgi:hypothetical protein